MWGFVNIILRKCACPWGPNTVRDKFPTFPRNMSFS